MLTITALFVEKPPFLAATCSQTNLVFLQVWTLINVQALQLQINKQKFLQSFPFPLPLPNCFPIPDRVTRE